MNSKGYLLAELLICLAAAAAVGVSAVGAYNSSLRLMQESNANLEAFNAATGACSAEELAARGLTTEKQEFYCEGLARPFYYVTVKNARGKILAGVVTGSE